MDGIGSGGSGGMGKLRVSCNDIMRDRINLFGGRTKGVVLGYCTLMAAFWVVSGGREMEEFFRISKVTD